MTDWTAGTRGAEVQAYQAALVALGYDLPRSTGRDGALDGVVGPEVLATTEAFVTACFVPDPEQRDHAPTGAEKVYQRDTVPEWVRLYVLEAAAALQVQGPAPRNTGLQHIGAWAGSLDLHPLHWRDSLRAVQDIGLTETSFMINDCTGARRDWHTFQPLPRLRTVFSAYRDAGIRVTATSWIRPVTEFVDRMVDAWGDLADVIDRFETDAEEVWTTARYEAHAKVAERIPVQRPTPLGVTAIVYHHRGRIAPLVDRADFVRLQAYATVRQTAAHLHPGTIIATTTKLMEARYGAEGVAKLEPAIAFYGREGAGGLSAAEATERDLRAIDRDPRLTATCGWSLGALRRDSRVRAVVRKWAKTTKGAVV